MIIDFRFMHSLAWEVQDPGKKLGFGNLLEFLGASFINKKKRKRRKKLKTKD